MFMKQHKFPITITLLALLLYTGQLLAAPDYAREKRWASEVVPGLIVGDPIYLKQQNGHAFLGILAEENNSKPGLIIVHGMGIHPDWGMVSTLRQRLFDYGFTTLSIQMPILAADASYKAYPAVFPDAVDRLKLAVGFLKQKGYHKIAIVSHSNGSRMSRVYMAENPTNIMAWAALSLTQGDTFAGINAPILDLYGSEDLPHVLASVDKRKASLINPASKQIVVSDSNHFFAGKEEQMVDAVKDFLQTLN